MAKKQTGIRSYGSGKFDTILDSYVYEIGGDGFDEEAGDVQENGIFYGLLRAITPHDVEKIAKQEGDELTEQERDYLQKHRKGGAIVSENDQGFVGVDFYHNSDDLENAWNDIENEIASFYEDEDEDGDEE